MGSDQLSDVLKQEEKTKRHKECTCPKEGSGADTTWKLWPPTSKDRDLKRNWDYKHLDYFQSPYFFLFWKFFFPFLVLFCITLHWPQRKLACLRAEFLSSEWGSLPESCLWMNLDNADSGDAHPTPATSPQCGKNKLYWPKHFHETICYSKWVWASRPTPICND